jgi:hypothetical protein
MEINFMRNFLTLATILCFGVSSFAANATVSAFCSGGVFTRNGSAVKLTEGTPLKNVDSGQDYDGSFYSVPAQGYQVIVSSLLDTAYISIRYQKDASQTAVVATGQSVLAFTSGADTVICNGSVRYR